MVGDTRRQALLVSSFLVIAGLTAGVATAQSSGPTAYYGSAQLEDGTDLPVGTTIIAVVDGDVRDSIEVDPAGKYGNDSPAEPDSKLIVDTDRTVHFYVVKDDGTRIEALRTADPTEADGAVERNLTFPEGTVTPAPYFTVSNLQPTGETVVDGEPVTVSANISNQVDSGTQTVSFRVNGQERNTTDLTLAPGETQTVTFDLDTSGLGTGSHTYTVATENDSQSASLTVEERRVDFAVSEFDPVETAVPSGETVDVSSTVTNEGNTEGTQTVRLDVDGTTVASSNVTLADGEGTTVEFTLGTADLSIGDHTHAIATADDSQSGTVTVRARRPNLTVADLDPTDGTAVTGERIAISATVTNEGNAEGAQTVTLDVAGETADSRDVTLGAGESTTLTFDAVDTGELGPGEYEHSVATGNDSRSGTLTVEDRTPPTFTISDRSQSASTVTAGTSVDVSATVSNVGETAGSQRVVLGFDGSTADDRTLSLAPDGSDRVTLTLDTASLEPGTYTYDLTTANDSQSGTVTVESDDDGGTNNGGTDDPTASFDITEFRPSDPTVTQGESVDVTATITNNGNTGDSQQVRLLVDSEAVSEEPVTLTPGESATVTLTAGTGSLSVGDHIHSVATDDDRQAGTIQVTADDDSTPGQSNGTATPGSSNGTATPSGPNGTETTTGTTEDGSDDSGGLLPGGLIPGGLLGTLLTWVGIPLLIVYGILKAMAIYLGY